MANSLFDFSAVEGVYSLEEAVPRFQSFIWHYMLEKKSGIVFLP